MGIIETLLRGLGSQPPATTAKHGLVGSSPQALAEPETPYSAPAKRTILAQNLKDLQAPVVRPAVQAETTPESSVDLGSGTTLPPGEQKPKADVAPQGNFMEGLKDFFIDKERGGMTMHGLLTLGALARAVTGGREAAQGMKGGGVESANLGAFMSGATQGVQAKQEQFEKDKLAREKMASDERIAANKITAAAENKPSAQDKFANMMISKSIGTPDWMSEAKLQNMVKPEHAGTTGDVLRYWYLNDIIGPSVADYFMRMGGSAAFAGTAGTAVVPPANTTGANNNPAGI